MTKLGRFGENESPQSFVLESVIADGDEAGDNIAVPGIKPGDQLVTVIDLSAAGENLRDEFSATAADVIQNNGDTGTDTTGMTLLVQWVKAETGRTGY